MTKSNAKSAGRKPSRKSKGAPLYNGGRFALATVSVAMGLFGTLGWAASDGEWYFRVLMGFLSASSAVVIPLTIPALGRSSLSYLLLLPMTFFGGVGAYSFHHAVEALVEGPRIAAHVQSLDELQGRVTMADEAVVKAKAALDAVEAPALPERCKQVACPETIKANAASYAAALAPKTADLSTAKTEAADLRKEYDAKVEAYAPMIDGTLVWIAGLLLDLSLAVGFLALEDAHRRQQQKLDAKKAAEKAARIEAALKRAEIDARAEANSQELALKAKAAAERKAKRAAAERKAKRAATKGATAEKPSNVVQLRAANDH